MISVQILKKIKFGLKLHFLYIYSFYFTENGCYNFEEGTISSVDKTFEFTDRLNDRIIVSIKATQIVVRTNIRTGGIYFFSQVAVINKKKEKEKEHGG